MDFMPELLRFTDGTPVRSPADMAARRREMISLLENEAYGKAIPPVPVSGRRIATDAHCACGTAVVEDLRICCKMDKNTEYSFPLRLYRQTSPGKKPLLLLLNFSDKKYHEYLQPEFVLQNGFSLAVLHYEHLTRDNGDFSDGLAAFFPRRTDGTGAGKITIWAWGAGRALDYLLSREDVDETQVALIGHSRLGKTALWCAAQDDRIRYVCSNDSGCMGAACHRTLHEGGESLKVITRAFPFWFCDNLVNRHGQTDALPFDQHFLLACVAPRYVCINSAAEDAWADPASEQLSCVGASPAWAFYGKTGFSGNETPCGVDEGFPDGEIAYYKRSGKHFLGLPDWANFIGFIKDHRNND